mmetsp:Transcript_98456/g.254546  ORF Transcript_98456/g.254546 Transcript_98456/m.254546 type:complete len:216 (-) Transcript_98456:1559-2206(-)
MTRGHFGLHRCARVHEEPPPSESSFTRTIWAARCQGDTVRAACYQRVRHIARPIWAAITSLLKSGHKQMAPLGEEPLPVGKVEFPEPLSVPRAVLSSCSSSPSSASGVLSRGLEQLWPGLPTRPLPSSAVSRRSSYTSAAVGRSFASWVVHLWIRLCCLSRSSVLGLQDSDGGSRPSRTMAISFFGRIDARGFRPLATKKSSRPNEKMSQDGLGW